AHLPGRLRAGIHTRWLPAPPKAADATAPSAGAHPARTGAPGRRRGCCRAGRTGSGPPGWNRSPGRMRGSARPARSRRPLSALLAVSDRRCVTPAHYGWHALPWRYQAPGDHLHARIVEIGAQFLEIMTPLLLALDILAPRVGPGPVFEPDHRGTHLIAVH